jgi:hypothetical protein
LCAPNTPLAFGTRETPKTPLPPALGSLLLRFDTLLPTTPHLADETVSPTTPSAQSLVPLTPAPVP